VSEAGALVEFVPADCVWVVVINRGRFVITASQVSADCIARYCNPEWGIAADIHIAADLIAAYFAQEIVVHSQIALNNAT
jgi:hypothetical protein